jgi:hypothetical protein
LGKEGIYELYNKKASDCINLLNNAILDLESTINEFSPCSKDIWEANNENTLNVLKEISYWCTEHTKGIFIVHS